MNNFVIGFHSNSRTNHGKVTKDKVFYSITAKLIVFLLT